MQEQLLKTAVALRSNPSSVLVHFQKTLSRPSYFYAPAQSSDWLVLLGPRPARKVPLRVLTPATDWKKQLQRLARRFWHQGARVHGQLQSLHEQLTSLSAVDVALQREVCLRVGRRARQMHQRVVRVQAVLKSFGQRLSPEWQRQVPMYARMLRLQSQRFQSLVQAADETSRLYRTFHRLHRRVLITPAVQAMFAVLNPSQPAVARSPLAVLFRGTVRSVHQWLMHPLVDTRDPAEPAS